MDILVFGAGAVGGFFGARLAQINHNVTLVGRGPAYKAITANGLTLIENEEQVTSRPSIVESLRQAFMDDAVYDLILVCTKAYDAEAALNELVAFCPQPPTIITLQNGIGIEELFIAEFGAEKVIAGSLTTPLSHETYHSIIVERQDRGLALAPTQAGQNIDTWVNLFQEAGIETVGLKDYQSMKWSKALLNMVGNATAAILNRHPGVVYGYRPTFNLEMDMIKETLVVMKKQKIKRVNLPGASTSRLAFAARFLPRFLVKPFLARIVSAGRGNKMPSFHIDLMAGRTQNEVSFHNGRVSEIGRQLGVTTPVNTALNDILIKIAYKEIDYQRFNGRPRQLVAAVDRYRQAAK